MLDLIRGPWPWYVSGFLIAIVLVLLLFMGKTFGFSSNFRTLCAICGGGKQCSFFDFDWKAQRWNLLFLIGSVLGGLIGTTILKNKEGVKISEATIADLQALGLGVPNEMQPTEIFSWESLATVEGWIILVLGGFLVGFGSRYAGGCTSGHAISGLSNLQLPSLVAVIGFFIGGLFSTFIILPWLLA